MKTLETKHSPAPWPDNMNVTIKNETVGGKVVWTVVIPAREIEFPTGTEARDFASALNALLALTPARRQFPTLDRVS